MRLGEERVVDHRWRLRLQLVFDPAEHFQQRIAIGIGAGADQGLQGRVDAGLPVDQRAVAIKGQRLEVAQSHGVISVMPACPASIAVRDRCTVWYSPRSQG